MYGAGASHVALLLKLVPCNHDGQKIVRWSVEVNDEPVQHWNRNGYGDAEALWVQYGHMDMAKIVATGLVETQDQAGVITGLPGHVDPAVFLRETPLTKANGDVRALVTLPSQEGDLARLHALSDAVHEAVAYSTGATSAVSTAAEALAQGSGVCQDHAHIFISAARSAGMPARYVTGYLLANDDNEALHETHGWAEAFVSGLGWVGFDPSNGVCVTPNYVRLAIGTDAHDAAPVRGSVKTAGEIFIDADVRIAQASEDDIEQAKQQQQ
ncbi:MAG: transglutaminase family protein [Alphaproteobacteria bacterium]|nr:transglutaminase family protein [Alphaproteobacteria bacterium]